MKSPKKSIHPIDAHVGFRVRIRRKLLSLSQTRLGDAVGLTFQQIQKYERGANRIGASRLFEIAQVLDVPVSYFFEDLPEEIAGRGAAPDETGTLLLNPLEEPQSMELVRIYSRIEDPQTKKALFNLAKTLGKAARSK